MVYVCECGCKLINNNAKAIERHEMTLKHLVLSHGVALEDYKTINTCQRNIRRWRALYEDSYNPLRHDLAVLDLYCKSLGLPMNLIDLTPYGNIKP